MAGVAMELLYSIVLAGGNRMNKDLEGLDNPAKSVSNPSGGPMWMRDCLGEWFCLESLKKMIVKTILKVSTNQTNDQSINQINQTIELTINRSRPTNQVINNDCALKPKVIANK